MSSTSTEARLRYRRARSIPGRLTHKVLSATIYWDRGRPRYIYTTWACGRTTPRPVEPRPDDDPVTCRGCASADEEEQSCR